MSLEIEAADGRVVRLEGAVEEGFALGPTGGDVLVIDLAAVGRISSFGVREWVKALSALEVKELYFINAPPSIVSQFNMVRGFDAGGQLVSLELPYVCEECDLEMTAGVDLRDQYARLIEGEYPEVRCPNCDAACVLDDDPRVYLSYVSSKPRPVVSQVASQLIDGGAAAAVAVEMSAEKDVTPALTALWLRGPLGRGFRRVLDDIDGLTVVILAGVTQLDEGAGRHLAELFSAAGVDAWAARLPVELVIDDALRKALTGRVASLRVRASCPCGGSADDVRTHGEVEGDLISLACLDCGAMVTRAVSKDVSGLLGAAPESVTGYLELNEGDALGDAQDAAATPMLGRYRVVRELGSGGMASVFLARQRGPAGFRKRVALKRVLAEQRDPKYAQMLLREARLVASISHPNVVQVFEVVQHEGRYFIALEYVKGWDLYDVLRATRELDRPLDANIVCRIAADIAAGLHAAHTAVDDNGAPLGIVHGDLSPRNILISHDGIVKVADFGVSVAGAQDTPRGVVRGTPAYMAPEQMEESFGPVDARADVFSLGILLHEMIAGASPFRREEVYETINAVLTSTIPIIPADRGSAELRALIDRAMNRQVTKRFGSAAELRDGLENVLGRSNEATTSASVAQFIKALMDEAIDAGFLMAPLVTPTASPTPRSRSFPPTQPIKRPKDET